MAWEQPLPVDDVRLAFPSGISHLMPRYADIPDEFKRMKNPWCEWQSKWFYGGLSSWPKMKPGIDQVKAKRHLAAIQRSFEPKHEHKEAAVAYLASLWMELEEIPCVSKKAR